ncbi:single-stranded DNA-binding protein [Schumannella soli]|uniref:Single-stranded DNA-binding protein n=1 Tax=Schumannella soli TaxID=2590779 RepID=A0A506Y2G1_9MICO|nr:single-stranded DNA-binding protein [Schumannella soli]TPW74589.1 single-stranded DNA-binding protein [Schumannella soli]
MSDTITLTGLVGTEPRHVVTGDGLEITTFRLVSTHRRFDRVERKWIDGDTNWYTISSFRHLAGNVHGSVKQGDRVVVTGRVRLKEWTKDDRSGVTVDIEADAIGHDLSWGTSVYSRVIRSSTTKSDGGEGSEASREESAASSSGSPTGAGPVDADGWAAPGADADRPAALDDAIPTPF